MSRIEASPLGEVVSPTRQRVKPSDYPDLPFIGMEHVEAHSMKLLGTVSAATMKSSAVHFKSGDVLYGRLRPYLNKVYRPKFEGLCSAEFIVFPENERIDGGYLQYFLNSAVFVRYASHLNTGDRPRVDFDQLAPYEIPLPDVDKQGRIVAEIEKQLSRLDQAVASLKRVKANLARQKLSILASATSGRLLDGWSAPAADPTCSETGTGLPAGWHWAEIGDLSDVVRGGSPRPAGDPRYFGGPVPWITVGPITADDDDYLRSVPTGLTDAGRERSRYIEPHTLLLTNSGATLGVPKISLIGGCINDGVAALLNVDYPLKKYLLIYLRSKTAEMRRVNQGAAQPNLNTTIIKRLRVPVPPTEAQHRIVAEVDRRLSVIREGELDVESNAKRAQVLRQAILQSVLSSESRSRIEHRRHRENQDGSI